MTLLSIRDLCVHRDRQPVVHIDSLDIEQGETLAVVGPNGAGKTTFLLALDGLIRPQSGRVAFQGETVQNLQTVQHRRRIGLVMQDPLLLHGSVYDNVAIGLRFLKWSRPREERRVGECLERLGISHLKNKPAQRLSGGEAQRVSLARALAIDPPLLFLDEPFSALDAPTRQSLLLDFKKLVAQEHKTVIFITHDLEEAKILATRVAVMMRGAIRQVGAPQAVFSSPLDEEIAAFVGIESLANARVVQAQGELLTIAINGAQVHAVGKYPVGSRVVFCLRPEHVTLWNEERGSPPSSARNHLKGVITQMVNQGALVRVILDCGFPLTALITAASAEDLNLFIGKTILASFKASAVHLIPTT